MIIQVCWISIVVIDVSGLPTSLQSAVRIDIKWAVTSWPWSFTAYRDYIVLLYIKIAILLLMAKKILHRLVGGSISHYLQGLYIYIWYIPGGCLGFQPSTVWHCKDSHESYEPIRSSYVMSFRDFDGSPKSTALDFSWWYSFPWKIYGCFRN